MELNQIGQSDLYISPLTLGCMSLGTNTNNAEKIIHTALEAGINHLDTADLYDYGENERIVGSVIQEKRHDVILTSKVGNHFDPKTKEHFWDPSKKHIINGLKESLQRLNTDYIDLYMLHGGTIDDPIDESIEAFETLKKEGLIRAYGISSIRPNVIREYVKHSSIDAVMMQYSLLDRRPEENILDLLLEQEISVLARGPLAKGLLTSQAQQIIETKGKDGYLTYSYDDLQRVETVLQQLTNEIGSFNELALKYVLQHPAVASAVFGASSIEQVQTNTNMNFDNQLPHQIYKQLQTITQPTIYTNHR